LALKSVIFQKAWGVRKFGSPHFLHEYTTIKRIMRKYFINDVHAGDYGFLSKRVRYAIASATTRYPSIAIKLEIAEATNG
jgi:hypothetical protein